MSVLIVGSIAIDTVKTPVEEHSELLGGSASYAALAASAAYEAEPPNKSECSSTGVLTVSIAMEPTTRTDMIRKTNAFVPLNRRIVES